MKTIFSYLVIGLCIAGFFSIFYMINQQSWPECLETGKGVEAARIGRLDGGKKVSRLVERSLTAKKGDDIW